FSPAARATLSTRHGREKCNFTGAFNRGIRSYVAVIDGGADHMRIFESVGIFVAASGEPAHQFSYRLYSGLRFYDFFWFANTLAHPGEITQSYAHSSAMY